MATRTLEEILVEMRRRVGLLERRSAAGGGRAGGSLTLRFLRGTTARRDAMFTPTTDAERATLANRKVLWFNTDRGWLESYFAVDGTPGLTVVGVLGTTTFATHPAGWYPLAGSTVIIAHKGHQEWSGNMNSNPGTVLIDHPSQVAVGGIQDFDRNQITVTTGGYYRVRAAVLTADFFAKDGMVRIRINGVNRVRYEQSDMPGLGNANPLSQAQEVIMPLVAGDRVEAFYDNQDTTTSPPEKSSFMGAEEYGGYEGTFLELVYQGPPLASRGT
jgi:hypothetical protein